MSRRPVRGQRGRPRPREARSDVTFQSSAKPFETVGGESPSFFPGAAGDEKRRKCGAPGKQGATVDFLSVILAVHFLPHHLKALDRFPPLSAEPTWGASSLGANDSLLGTVATAHEGGTANLKRLVGALCVAVSKANSPSFMSPGRGTRVFAIFEDSALELNVMRSPLIPPLPDTVISNAELSDFRGLLRPRRSIERDRRFRVALEFLAAGWNATGSQAFMSYFIALEDPL
jgi:hypothetical protein